MTCLSPHEITEAATTGDLDVELGAHVGDCLACRRKLESERALREQLRRLPVPVLPVARRRELAAELVARAERQPRARSRPWVWTMSTAAALAAAAVLVWQWPRAPGSIEPPIVTTRETACERPTVAARMTAREEVPPPRSPPRIEAQLGAQLSQRVDDDRDLLTLADGTIDVDTRAARGADVKIGNTVVSVDDAKVTVRAQHRAIVSVHVIVGAAGITGPDRRIVVERGSIWLAEPPAAQRSLRAFRDAWIALRAGRNRSAIELFDAATDRTVAEEAAYWAAIAAKRAGAGDLARERLNDFVQRFPQSPYVAQARALLGAP